MYNAFFMDSPVPSFVFHSSLLTAKHADLTVAHDGFLFIMEKILYFYTELVVNGLNTAGYKMCNSYFTFQKIIDILGE